MGDYFVITLHERISLTLNEHIKKKFRSMLYIVKMLKSVLNVFVFRMFQFSDKY